MKKLKILWQIYDMYMHHSFPLIIFLLISWFCWASYRLSNLLSHREYHTTQVCQSESFIFSTHTDWFRDGQIPQARSDNVLLTDYQESYFSSSRITNMDFESLELLEQWSLPQGQSLLGKKASKEGPRDKKIKQKASWLSHLDQALPEARPPPDFSIKWANQFLFLI